SHELATPLTPITGYLKILRSGKTGILTDQQLRILDSMGMASERLSRTIDNLVDFATLESGGCAGPRDEFGAQGWAKGVSDGRPPGAGLGLPVSKQTVEAHGGRSWAESPPKNQPDSRHHFSGAKVAFWIPSRAQAPADPPVTPQVLPEGGTS